MPKTSLPQIPGVPRIDDASLRHFLESLKQAVEVGEGQRGDKRDRKLTERDLLDMGLAEMKGGRLVGVGGGPTGSLPPGSPLQPPPGGVLPILTTPPDVVGLTANGLFTSVLVSWGFPEYANHAHTEIRRSATPDFGEAVEVGLSPSTMFVDTVGNAETYYYWARHISTEGVEGVWAGPAEATTPEDPGQSIIDISEAIRNDPYIQELFASMAGDEVTRVGSRLLGDLSAAIGNAIRVDYDDRIRMTAEKFEKEVNALSVRAGHSEASQYSLNAAFTNEREAWTIRHDQLYAQTLGKTVEIDHIVKGHPALIITKEPHGMTGTEPGASVHVVSDGDGSLADHLNRFHPVQIDSPTSLILPDVNLEYRDFDSMVSGTLQYGGTLGLHSQLSTTFADEHGALVESLTGSITHVNDNYAALYERARSWDGVGVQWGVKTDVNGLIGGLGVVARDLGPIASIDTTARPMVITMQSPHDLDVGVLEYVTIDVLSSGGSSETRSLSEFFNGSYQRVSVISDTELVVTDTENLSTAETFDNFTSGFVGYGVQVYAQADRFAILPRDFHQNSDAVAPFIVQDGKVYMDEALIREAAITTLHVQDGFFENITARHGIFPAAQIEKGAFNQAYLSGPITSGYLKKHNDQGELLPQDQWQWISTLTENDGWAIFPDGEMIMNRGRINAINVIDTLQLRGQSVTFPVVAYKDKLQIGQSQNKIWVDVFTLTVPAISSAFFSPDAPRAIYLNLTGTIASHWTSSSDLKYTYIRLLQNGTPIYAPGMANNFRNILGSGTSSSGRTTIAHSTFTNPGEDDVVYTVQIMSDMKGGTISGTLATAWDICLMAMDIKR